MPHPMSKAIITYGDTTRVSSSHDPVEDCAHSSNQPKVVDPGEQGSGTKHSLRADNSPNNTGIIEGCGAGTNKALGLVWGAEFRDVTNEKVEGSDLDKRQPDYGEQLSSKHGPGGDFHLRDVG